MDLLDAGVWIAAKNEQDRFANDARRLVLDTNRAAAALDLTFYEVANVVGSVWGQHREAASLCRTLSLRCDRVVAVDVGLLDAGIALAAEYGLSAYDAAYVAVARRYDWRLVSTDLRDLVSKGLAITPDAAV
jgi:predicted nucleic acid-binding protein